MFSFLFFFQGGLPEHSWHRERIILPL